MCLCASLIILIDDPQTLRSPNGQVRCTQAVCDDTFPITFSDLTDNLPLIQIWSFLLPKINTATAVVPHRDINIITVVRM